MSKILFRRIGGRIVPILKRENVLKPLTTLGKRVETVQELRAIAKNSRIPSKKLMFKTEARKEGLKIDFLIKKLLKQGKK